MAGLLFPSKFVLNTGKRNWNEGERGRQWFNVKYDASRKITLVKKTTFLAIKQPNWNSNVFFKILSLTTKSEIVKLTVNYDYK